VTSHHSTKDYEVGYGRPPIHTRFKPGQSGNPAGRPKGTQNFATEIAAELKEAILVKEAGVTKRVSKRRAMIKRQAERALQGDTRAFSCLVAMSPGEKPAEGIVLPSDLEPGDRALIERYLSKQAGSPERGK
jgi:uncharacterized protein DUF5681